MNLIEKSDDCPIYFNKLYEQTPHYNKTIGKEISDFISLQSDLNLSVKDLFKFNNNFKYNEGLDALNSIVENLPKDLDVQILPFMSKSWDACDKMMFDIRHNDFEGALTGGGNFCYNKFHPDKIKSGAGLGVTRLFNLIYQNN